MELFTILLASLLGIVSPVGVVVEQVAANAIRDQLEDAELLAVRIDNAPSYRLLQGQVDRVRIAGRGIYPLANVRIEALEVETDAIAVDPDSLSRGEPQLEQPLNAGVRLVLTEADLNRALQSPELTEPLRDLSLDLLGSPAEQLERYDFVNFNVEFLENQRLRFQGTLQAQQSPLQIPIVAESGLQIRSGRQLELVEPTVSLNGEPLPPQLIALLTSGISQQLDLATLDDEGITARILHFELSPEQLTLAAFVRIDPQFTEPESENQ
ncbi:MAG: DUF2993 domain-containing protein [Synechococcales cyanobacterium M58_A2018_015]|nr:DUF2993 domain-containing protein [Synechococcales cyanobacterium M58_A2018_015]